MAITAQNWIEAAYARSTANDPGKTAEDTELLAVANRSYQALFAMAAASARGEYQSRLTMVLVAGVGTLPVDVIDIVHVRSGVYGRVNVYPIEDLDKLWASAPAMFREGTKLISRGAVGDPAPTDSLTLWVLDAPVALTTLGTTIDPRFPERWHNLPILDVAMYLDAKDQGREASGYQKLKAEHDALMQAFLVLNKVSLTALQTPHGGAIEARFAGGKA